MRIFAIALVAAALGVAATARAQDFDAAQKYFRSAQEAFGKHQYRTAAVEFQAAYDITKDPVLLYNVGEAWQKGGEGRKAVASYKAYLKASPTAQDRADVQARIKMIESKKFKIASQSAPGDVAPGTTTPPPVAAAAAPPPAPAATAKPDVMQPSFDTPPPAAAPAKPAPAPEDRPMAPSFDSAPPAPAAAAPAPAAPTPAAAPPAPPPPVETAAPPPPGVVEEGPVSRLRVAAWVGVAATVAVLTAGAIFGLAAQSRGDEISRRFTFVDSTGQPRKFDASAQSDYQNLKDEGNLYNGLAIGFFAGAGALAVVTTVLFIVDAKRPAPTQHALRLMPTLGPRAAGLSAGWSF
jgi:hypothetical protein